MACSVSIYNPVKLNIFKNTKVTNSKSRMNVRRNTCITKCKHSVRDPPGTLEFKNWAPELINGRCAMLGYVAGYGYEFVKNESITNQLMEYAPYFALVSGLVTLSTLKTGKPSKDDVVIDGLTPDAELFNGRAAMLGITLTLLYEYVTKQQILN